MMTSPSSFIEELKDADFFELVCQRDQLLRNIKRFEKKEMAGDRSGKEWKIKPGPDVMYQVNLEYLSALCNMMKGKYNLEYVWGNKTLDQSTGKVEQ